ncbi:MAG: PSD1 and planctomycete cytochrome C domain-containing protein [Pirellulaceae bacterium]
MKKFSKLSITVVTWTAVFLQGTGVARSQQTLKYNRDIRPILADHCFTCHGPDAKTRVNDLRLDRRDVAVAENAIDLEELSESEILKRIFSSDPSEQMPPPDFLKRLSDTDRATLKQWIEGGATYEEHWAYVPPTRIDLKANQAIDHWIDESLKAKGLTAAGAADRETLLRRVYLDLVGLPPSLEQRQAFLANNDPRAYEKLVDELIASPQFGERMAVGWLDVVRYADTVGYHGDQNQNVFPYRDWVINAFNQNMPFDQFTLHQLAGDQIENPTTESRIASCFNRLNMMTREGGAQPGEYLAKYAADRVRTVSGAWLGSTMGCAECHDHKYDPFTMKDFYSLSAYFADLRQWGVYQDYNYTPNPDLRGWSNDHPFPPEIVVEVPYLHERIAKLKRQRGEMIAAHLREHPIAKESWNEWQRQAAEYVAQHPDGWVAQPPPAMPEDAPTKFTPNQDGSFTISSGKTDAFTFPIAATEDLIASVSLELLSDEAAGGKIFADGQANLGLAVELVEEGKSKPVPVRFEFADATEKLPRYANTFEILGIVGHWRIAATMPAGLRGTWIFDQPLQLEAGKSLQLKITGNRCRNLRISISRFVPEDASKATEWSSRLVELKTVTVSPADASEFVQRQWAMTSAAQKTLAAKVREIERAIHECRNGQSPVQVSESHTPLVTRILPRGNWQDESGEVVLPATPHFLPQGTQNISVDQPHLRRIDLARWLVDKENPLTARVQMNRLWKHFFGTGLSGGLDDFGLQGQYPTHPELLDWLALEFQESGWDFKHMVKLIVMSKAYQRSSAPSPRAQEIDPKNLWLSHQNPRRLEAEIVRDNALAISGLINLDRGGPAVFPYQPPNYYEHLQFPDRRYVPNTDDRRFRRGMYTHWQRTFLHPMLANFDAPAREECTAQRNEANTPQQALTLLNDPTFVEAAMALAATTLNIANDDQERIRFLLKRALSREPTATEANSLASFIAAQKKHFEANLADAEKLIAFGNSQRPANVDAATFAAWTQAARAVLNLHETITRY